MSGRFRAWPRLAREDVEHRDLGAPAGVALGVVAPGLLHQRLQISARERDEHQPVAAGDGAVAGDRDRLSPQQHAVRPVGRDGEGVPARALTLVGHRHERLAVRLRDEALSERADLIFDPPGRPDHRRPPRPLVGDHEPVSAHEQDLLRRRGERRDVDRRPLAFAAWDADVDPGLPLAVGLGVRELPAAVGERERFMQHTVVDRDPRERFQLGRRRGGRRRKDQRGQGHRDDCPKAHGPESNPDGRSMTPAGGGADPGRTDRPRAPRCAARSASGLRASPRSTCRRRPATPCGRRR